MAPTSAALSGKPTFKAWLVVGLLFIVGGLNYLDRVMLTTMHKSIVESIPMTEAEFGLLTSVFLAVYGILSPFAGYMADKFSRSRVIIFSLFIWSLLTWLTGQATSFPTLLGIRALMGISEACYIPAALALIADYHKGNTRSFAVGLHMAGVMTGQSLGFLGGEIAEKHSWSHAFQVFGVIGIVYAVVLFFLLRDPKKSTVVIETKTVKEELNFWDALKGLFAQRKFNLLLIFWALLGMIGWMIIGWLPTYFQEHFHLSQTDAGKYATAFIYPLSMAGVIAGGAIADAWGRKNKYAVILLPAIGMCIAAPAVYLASDSNMLAIAVGGFMLYAFTRVFSDANLMSILCMFADKRYLATGYGLLNLFACIVGGLGIYASGALRDQHVNMSLIFKVAALSMAVCVILLLIVKKDIKRSAECVPEPVV